MSIIKKTAAVFITAALSSCLRAEEAELLSLEQAESIALESHPSVRLVDEEAGVARLKRMEAYRAVWPAITLKAERTRGESVRELGTPDFTEKSYMVQASQPLLQGGRLWRVYKQSRAGYESLQAKADKARQEVLYGVREATWNYIKAARALEIHQKALKDLAKEKGMADGLRQKDVISPQVFLTINSQYQQAALAVDGTEAELTARLWQWTAALGLNEPPPSRPDPAFPTEEAVQVSLEECLRLSASHPDLMVQGKASEAARYGYQANAGLYWPRFSANGSYGRSGGAFDRERLELREDYTVGVQLVQYFGGSTINASGLRQRTSPKIGQTTRTESTTGSASLGVLDGFKQRTEKAESRFSYHQAAVQEERTRLDVFNNVREAYAGFRKALAQKKIAENDLALAKTEADIARIKSAHREVPLSERAVTRNKLAQAETAHMDARAGYRIALAALARAVGDPDFPKETQK
jgi:outer membrane protein TolC